jgi:hypothetical protein
LLPLKANFNNLVLPESLPAAGRFEFTKNLKVRDLINGSTFFVGGSPDPDTFFTEFEFEGVVIKGTLYSQAKYPDRPMVRGSPDNPSLMISVYAWSRSFASNKMIDREFNSRLAVYMAHMIAFRNSVCFSYRVFLWGGFRETNASFDMPSDDDLLNISTAWQNI